MYIYIHVYIYIYIYWGKEGGGNNKATHTSSTRYAMLQPWSNTGPEISRGDARNATRKIPKHQKNSVTMNQDCPFLPFPSASLHTRARIG